MNIGKYSYGEPKIHWGGRVNYTLVNFVQLEQM